MLKASAFLKTHQRVLVYVQDRGNGLVESLIGQIQTIQPTELLITLNQTTRVGEAFALPTGTGCTVVSQALGLSIRISGVVDEQLQNSKLRIRALEPPVAFQTRQSPRVDIVGSIQHFGERGALETLRQKWLSILAKVDSTAGERQTQKLGPINISADGFQFRSLNRFRSGDCAIFAIQYLSSVPPILALSETVWSAEPAEDGTSAAGFRFVAIRKTDQEHLRQFVQDTLKSRESDEPSLK